MEGRPNLYHKILPTVARPILNCFAIELAEEPSVEALMTCNFSANVNSFCFDDFCGDGDGLDRFSGILEAE